MQAGCWGKSGFLVLNRCWHDWCERDLMRMFISLCCTFFLFPLGVYSQANTTVKAIPSDPALVLSPNSDPAVMDGIWKVTWKDEAWPYGSIFQLQSGSVGGGPYKVVLAGSQSILQGPNLGDGIPLKIAGDGTRTGVVESKVFTISPHAPNVPSSITASSLNGKWNCRVYGQSNTPFTVANSSVTGWGEGSGSIVLEPGRIVATFPNGAQFWLYYVSSDEWLGFGKFPTDELSFRPVIWQRAGKP